MDRIKIFIKFILPPFLFELYRNYFGRGIYFRGAFSSWEDASHHAIGYDDMDILEVVRASSRKVASGQQLFERDSVIFNEKIFPFPLIATLLRAGLENNKCLSVLDFGGALGSSYYQCKDFLVGIEKLSWHVVEQKHFVNIGRNEFETKELKFYDNIADACNKEKPTVILASGVMQYLQNPLEILDSFSMINAQYLVIDRTPFSGSGAEIISTQYVSGKINRSSYPVRLFNESLFKNFLSQKYLEVATFESVDGVIGSGALKASFKGFIFKNRNYCV